MTLTLIVVFDIYLKMQSVEYSWYSYLWLGNTTLWKLLQNERFLLYCIFFFSFSLVCPKHKHRSLEMCDSVLHGLTSSHFYIYLSIYWINPGDLFPVKWCCWWIFIATVFCTLPPCDTFAIVFPVFWIHLTYFYVQNPSLTCFTLINTFLPLP